VLCAVAAAGYPLNTAAAAALQQRQQQRCVLLTETMPAIVTIIDRHAFIRKKTAAKRLAI